MRDQVLSPPMGWCTYISVHADYRICYPPGWTVQTPTPDRLVLSHPDTWAQFAISHLPVDCDAARVALRAKPRLNHFLVREFRGTAGQQPAEIFEFRDTIAQMREFRAVLRVESGCYELMWRRSERNGAPDLASTLDTMLSTFGFTPEA